MPMRLYECTVYYKGSPWIVEGQEVKQEIVADSAGKARYRYWSEVHEYWDEVRITDIRVLSLAKRKSAPMAEGWQARLETANSIIRVMASHGRRFFSQDADCQERMPNPFIAHFTVDRNGELWFTDSYTQKPNLVRHREWPHFHNGGTLLAIAKMLGEHISKAFPVNNNFFMRSPKWVCDGDPWGYGEEMINVEQEVCALLKVSTEATNTPITG